MNETSKPVRPEWSTVAVHVELLQLACDMHERADQLGVLSADAGRLRLAAADTVIAADLVAWHLWSIDAGLAWLDAGRAMIERTRS